MPVAEKRSATTSPGSRSCKNYLPYWAANFVDRTLILLIPIFGVLIPAIKFAPMLYTYRLKSRIGRWYEQLAEVEVEVARQPDPAARASTISRGSTRSKPRSRRRACRTGCANRPTCCARRSTSCASGCGRRSHGAGDSRSPRPSRTARTLERPADWRKVVRGRRSDRRARDRKQHLAHVRPAAVAGIFYPGAPLGARVGGARAPCAGGDAARPRRPRRPRRSSCRTPATSTRGRSPPRRTRASRAGARRSGASCCSARRIACRSAGSRCRRSSAFATPLGEVAVDRAAVADALTLPQVVDERRARTRTSTRSRCSCRSCRRSSTISASCRSPSATRRRARSREVLDLLWGGAETLIVVSSDLSHYHRYADARSDRSRDRAMRSSRCRRRSTTSRRAARRRSTACSLTRARRGLAPELLDLRNSGDTAGDKARVVGYASFAFVEPDHGGDRR